MYVLMSGNLNSGSNPSTVKTRIGHYDDDNGHYFQYDGINLSIVERASVSGALVETVVNQSEWSDYTGSEIDVRKNLIFLVCN